MRLRQNRIEQYFHCKRNVVKDGEGSTSEEYGEPSPFYGESWPASGKVQAQQYGQRFSYIRNLKIDGSYSVKTDEKGKVHYILENGADIMELDGICIFTGESQNPDYKVISIKPYRFLTLEVEKL